MNSNMSTSKKRNTKRAMICLLAILLLIASSGGIGYLIGAASNVPIEAEATGYAANPAYEYMVASAAWQTSASIWPKKTLTK